MTKIQFLFIGTILLTCASAVAQGPVTTRQMGTSRTTGGNTTPGSYTVPAPKDPDLADLEQQRIWNAARKLDLNSDQHGDLASALKKEKDQRAVLAKALQDARRALADAVANGQTFLDSEIENLTNANAKMQESDLKLWAQLYAVLTPDQQRRLLGMSTPLPLPSAGPPTLQGQ